MSRRRLFALGAADWELLNRELSVARLPRRPRDRIAAEPFHQRAFPAQFLERRLHRGVVIVPRDIEEEDVIPRAQAARTRYGWVGPMGGLADRWAGA